MGECTLRICHQYRVLDPLVWANTGSHQILLKDLRNLIWALEALLDCGISFTAVYIWINMFLQSSCHQLTLRSSRKVLLCWVTQDFELYAAFDPLADKALAIKTCSGVCQWVKDVENEIILLGASPFSW